MPDLEQYPEAELHLDSGMYWLRLTEDQAEHIAGGYVPRSVKAILRELLDYQLEDERRAGRPIRGRGSRAR
jgi:hypothetical protein